MARTPIAARITTNSSFSDGYESNNSGELGAEEIVNAFTKLWNLNPKWKVFDHRQTDHINPRFVRISALI